MTFIVLFAVAGRQPNCKSGCSRSPRARLLAAHPAQVAASRAAAERAAGALAAWYGTTAPFAPAEAAAHTEAGRRARELSMATEQEATDAKNAAEAFYNLVRLLCVVAARVCSFLCALLTRRQLTVPPAEAPSRRP